MKRLIVLDSEIIILAVLKSDSSSSIIISQVISGDLIAVLSPAIAKNYFDILSKPLFKAVKLPPIWLKVLIEQAHFFANNLMFVDLAAHTGAVLISSNINQAAHKHIDILKIIFLYIKLIT